MLSMLLAYDAEGNVVATLDFMVARDEAGEPVGLIDFESHERDGGDLTQVWNIDRAVGSGTWPEWIGAAAHEFRVEVDPSFSRGKKKGERPDHRIKALVHKTNGHRRERAAIESEIARRIAEANGKPADIRDLVGGPGRPLLLDETGQTTVRQPVERPELPVVPSRGNSVRR